MGIKMVQKLFFVFFMEAFPENKFNDGDNKGKNKWLDDVIFDTPNKLFVLDGFRE